MVQKDHMIFLYNLILLTGTTYLIVMLDWSVWWYAFTYLFLMNFGDNNDSAEKA